MTDLSKTRTLSEPVTPFAQLRGSDDTYIAFQVDENGRLNVVLADADGNAAMASDGSLLVRDALTDYTEPLIDGDLTADGIQWGAGQDGGLASAVTNVVNTWYTLFQKQLNPYSAGPNSRILWTELGLTIELTSNNDNSTGEWQWEASNDGTTWVPLHAVVAEADIDIAAVERTRAGYARLSENFDNMPYYLRLRVRCTSAGDTVTARVKNSSYARSVFLPA